MKILLAIDGSSFSDAAVREVARYSWPQGTQVHLVTVDAPLAPPSFPTDPSAIPDRTVFDELVHAQRKEALASLDKAATTLRQLAPHLDVQIALLEGSPKEQIVVEAENRGVDLIVVGSHGRGAVRRFFLGSVSMAVVLGATCSVLVVREKPTGPCAV